jgi:predicted ATPase
MLGIGKTRLVEAVLAEAEELGFHTLRGAAHEAEGRAPYAPFVEALDPLAGRRPDAGGRAQRQRPGGAVATAAVGAPAGGGGGGARGPRHRVFSAVAELLAEAAAERGVVLVIDDLHAADEATTALVRHLARSATGARLLVVATRAGSAHSAPTGYQVAAATVCARAGQIERGREFLQRAEHGAGRWLGGP